MGARERLIDLFHRVATGTRKTRTLLTPIGATAFAIFTCLFVFLAVLLDRWLALPWPLSAGASRVMATVLIVTGTGATGWSVLHFLKARGTPVPFNPPPMLGKYRPVPLCEKPHADRRISPPVRDRFAANSFSLVVLFTPFYILFNVWELKNIEEPELLKRLGEGYAAYREQTPMFLPGVRPRNR